MIQMAYFDNYSEEYKNLLAKHTGTSPGSDLTFFARQKAHHLRRALPDPLAVHSILDFGCGIGMAVRPLHLAFPKARITGVDPSTKSLDIAAQEHKDINTRLIPLADFNADPSIGNFDLIVISCVLHHIECDQHSAVLQSLRHRCSPTGKIAIFEHNPLNPLTLKTVRDCPFDEGVTLIRASQGRALLKASGWDNVKKRYITFVPPTLSKYKACEDWLPWCPLGGQYMLTAEPAENA
jgi:SAM-dependent methyltransferase